MKTYAFVFAKTHGTNRQRKSSPLANHDSENFHLTFIGGARQPLLLFLRPARNPPLCPQIFPFLLALNFPFFFSFFSFPPHLLTKQLKNKKIKEKENA
jgi:hypothetical protein